MEAIVRKLGHPLEEIRVRSLRSIHTKICMGLWPHPQSLPEKIQQQLIELLPSLAPDYTQAQDILTQLQAVSRTPQKPPATPVIHATRVFEPPVTSFQRPNIAKSDEAAIPPPVRSSAPPGAQAGWSFSHVHLGDADDQMLFEFEVKLKMHGSTQEGLRLFMEFGESLLRDFPPEVFLQRPAILQFILHLLQLPLIELAQPSAPGFGEALFGYQPKKHRRHHEASLFFVLVDLVQGLVDGLATSFRLHIDATYHTQATEPPSSPSLHRPTMAASRTPPSYPSAAPPSVRGDSWSYSGAMCHIFAVLASLLTRPFLPRLHVLCLMDTIVPVLRDVASATIEPFEFQRLADCFSVIAIALDATKTGQDAPSDDVVALYTWRLLLKMLAAMGPPTADVTALLPPRLMQSLEALVFDQDLFDTDPSIRRQLLPLAAAANPATAALLDEHMHVAEVVKNWRIFVEAVGHTIDASDAAPPSHLPHDALTLLQVLDHIPQDQNKEMVLKAAAQTLPLATQPSQLTDLLAKLLQCPITISSHLDAVLAALDSISIPVPPSIVLCVCRRLASTPHVDALWHVLGHLLHHADRKAIPFLQHWAYADVPVSLPHQQMQPALAARLIELQNTTTDLADNVLVMARCLLHTSEFVRRSAAVGLVSALLDDHTFVDQRDWMVHSDFTPGDPFGDVATPLRDHVLTFPLPPTTTRPRPQPSSVVASVQKFIAILTSPSLEWNIKESVLHQVIQTVGAMHPDGAAALSTSGELGHLIAAVVPFLADANPKFHLLPLVLVRDLLIVSPQTRHLVRASGPLLHVVLPFVFATDASLRAGAFLVVLCLTCAAEVWGDVSLANEFQVPSMIQSTFGVNAATWQAIGVSTYSISSSCETSTATPATTRRDHGAGTVLMQPPHDAVTRAVDALNRAASHREYLNAMYQLACLARLETQVAASVIASNLASKSIFLRILHAIPRSWRDEAALASLFHVLERLVPVLDVSDLLYILVAIKANAAPLVLEANQEYGGGLHVKVLSLLHAMARRHDMVEFVAAFLFETTLHDALRSVYLFGDDSAAQAVGLRLLRQVVVLPRSCLAAWTTDQLAPTLVQLVGEYHASDSFFNKDSIAWALSCLVAITDLSPSTVSTTNRFVFDRDARLRAMGYAVLPLDDATFVDLALDAVLDKAECPKVRAAAASYVLRSGKPIDEGYLTKLAKALEEGSSHGLPSEVVFAIVSLFDPANYSLLPSKSLHQLTSLEYHRQTYRRLCRAVTGVSISDLRPSTAASAFEETWAKVHRPAAMECVRLVLSAVHPIETSLLLRPMNEIFALTCLDDGPEYAHLLGVAVRLFSRVLDQVSVDQHQDVAKNLLDKLVAMVQLDHSVLSACHVIFHMAKHPVWKTQLQNAQGEAVCTSLITVVTGSPRHAHRAQVAKAVQSLLESHPSFFIAVAIKMELLVHCVAKLTGHLSLPADEIALHCNLIRAQVGHHVEAKQLATDLNLPALFASMWPHIQSTPTVMEAWLQALNNYVYQHQPAKQSLLGSPLDTTHPSCLKHLLHYAAIPTATQLLFNVLKSVLLNAECVLAAIKYGYVSKFMGNLAKLVYKKKGQSRDDPSPRLRSVLALLVNISFSPDGRAEICRFAHLEDALADLLATPALVEPTALLLRNLSFAPIAKAQFLHWKHIPKALQSFMCHENAFVCNFAATAMWSLLYNNQKATSGAMADLIWPIHVAMAASHVDLAMNKPEYACHVAVLADAQITLGHISRLIESNEADNVVEKPSHLDRLAVQLDTKFIRRDGAKAPRR